MLSFSIDDGRITSMIVIHTNYNQVNIPAKASFCNILDNRGQVIKTKYSQEQSVLKSMGYLEYMKKNGFFISSKAEKTFVFIKHCTKSFIGLKFDNTACSKNPM